MRNLTLQTALAVVSFAVSGALVADAVVEPARFGGQAASEPAVLGGFAIGDGVEGLVDPSTGTFSVTLPVAGLAVSWNSSAAAVDRSGLGGGWAIAGLAQVDVEGGVRVAPSSGGVYDAVESVPSGLAGYLLGDVVFRQAHERIPARADGRRAEQDTAFELIELGGMHTFFSADGDPIVRVDANGNRADWEWSSGHRLVRAIDAAGVVTVLDWSDPGRVDITTGSGSVRRPERSSSTAGGSPRSWTRSAGASTSAIRATVCSIGWPRSPARRPR
jgi:hypothetical protein